MPRLHTTLVLSLAALAPMPCAGCDEGSSASDSSNSSSTSSSGEAQSSAKPQSNPTGLPTLHLAPAFPRLTFSRPVFLTHAGDGTDRIFVIEQTGRIRVFPNRNDVETAKVFLDIRDNVQMNHNEEGLLALAFHPAYKDNGRFFVYYSIGNPKRNRISEFHVSSDDPDKADPASEKIILEVPQKYGNHDGSTLLFDRDGFLYISHGDGGLANDPDGNGQRLDTLLGKITRIDIDKSEDGKPYAIPPDNPFVDQNRFPGAKPEIWAYGLRNVWRMSFDRDNGDLWAGDVGQNSWEEIDLITKGGNYGWNIREGRHDFAAPPQGANAGGAGALIEPLAEYPHREGLSVTGGHVYRGSKQSSLKGIYIYGDYATGRIWGLRYDRDSRKVTASGEMLAKDNKERTFIASFGEDQAGELFVCAFDRLDGRSGKIMRVIGHAN